LGTDCPHGTHVCPIRDGLVYWSETVTIPYAPMLGCIGTAPDWGSPTTIPAGPHGGNMDVIETCPGNTIYLPVFVPGAYPSLGGRPGRMGARRAPGHGTRDARRDDHHRGPSQGQTAPRPADRVARGVHGGRQRLPDGTVGRPGVRPPHSVDGS